MDIRLKHCCFCGKLYYYQASGEGCFRNDNNENYCPRCQQIINQTLKENVPKKDIYTHIPIECEKFDNTTLEKLNKLKKEYCNKSISSKSVNIDFDRIEIYYLNRQILYIAYNNDNVEEKHYFIEKDYCIATKEIGKNYVYLSSDGFCNGFNILRSFEKMNQNIKYRNLDKPLGKLFFNIFEWDIITKKDNN